MPFMYLLSIRFLMFPIPSIIRDFILFAKCFSEKFAGENFGWEKEAPLIRL